MAKIIIIGAGLTGLSAAYHLEKRGYTDYALFEKEETVGGLCRSIIQDGFTFDYTGHLLHTSDSYFKKFITDIVGLENMNIINRRSFIYSHNAFTHYPFQINLHGLPPEVIADCVEGYVARPKTRKKPDSFPQWVQQTFGSGFAKHFFMPFQRKILAHNLYDITASWTGRFVPKTSLREMIIGAVQEKIEKDVGYNASFFYPKEGGIEFWIRKVAEQIKNPIHTQYTVSQIDLKNKVIYFSNGHEEKFDILINTMPLDRLINCLNEKPNTAFKQAAKNLKCNQVINFNLGVADPDLTDKHWIYFPEKEYPFYRIGFPHNFGDKMAPKGCSSLYGEISHLGISNNKAQQLTHLALKKTKAVLKINDNDVVTEKIIHISHAYVIYNFWREHNLPKLLNRLEQANIYSTGRYGAWKYSSMQEAVLDGKKVVEALTILPAQRDYFTPTQMQNQQQKEM
jgi:protoporphyrinogen oxidase